MKRVMILFAMIVMFSSTVMGQDLTFFEYKAKADRGDGTAQAWVSCAYYFGHWNVEKNGSSAYSWAVKSDAQNNDFGQYMLGLCLFDGFGVARNYDKAFQQFLKSHQNPTCTGAGPALMLGRCYLYGYGTAKNESKAFPYFKIAYERGKDQPGVIEQLAVCYEKGYGTPVSLPKAIELYEEINTEGARAKANALKAKVQADVIGSSMTAEEMYTKGLTYANNKQYTDAIYWYKKAANNGHGYANDVLGYLYEYGVGCDIDYEQALKYYSKAADYNVFGAESSCEDVRTKITNSKLIRGDEKYTLNLKYKKEIHYNVSAYFFNGDLPKFKVYDCQIICNLKTNNCTIKIEDKTYTKQIISSELSSFDEVYLYFSNDKKEYLCLYGDGSGLGIELEHEYKKLEDYDKNIAIGLYMNIARKFKPKYKS